MTRDFNELLRRHDDPGRWEYPPAFDHSGAVERFRAFVVDLQAALGMQVGSETGNEIQDASFHSQVLLSGGALRFSNFGEMVAFTPDHEIPAEVVDVATRLATGAGYIVVPTPLLETRYTGRNPGVTGIRDWWIRYFDWV